MGDLVTTPLSVSSGEDVIADVLGDNVLRGKGGDDDITGGSQIDHIDGGGGDDHLQGERGRDFIYGADGVDTCFGGYDAHLDPTCESRHFNGEVTPPAGEEAARFHGCAAAGRRPRGRVPPPETEFATGPIPQTFQSEVLVRYSTSILYSSVSDRGQGGLYLQPHRSRNHMGNHAYSVLPRGRILGNHRLHGHSQRTAPVGRSSSSCRRWRR